MLPKSRPQAAPRPPAAVPFLSARARAWRALARDRLALAGGVGVLAFLALAVLAPVLAPYDPTFQHPDGLSALGAPRGPDRLFLLGTDLLGRDLLSRVIWGARISLAVGVVSTAVALAAAAVVGLAAGYLPGAPRTVLLWVINAVLSVPSLLLMLALVAVLPRGLWVVVVVLTAVAWAYPARVIYGEVLSVTRRDFVDAARAIGAGPLRVVGRHVLPQLLPLLVVYFTLRVPATILAEASLSFLGLGVPPPAPSWGAIIHDGARAYRSAPWIFLFPGATVATAVVSFNLLGDGLRDAFDPTRGGRGR
ncbi:MAG: ABC transporter permease [Armatimonadota bacterium]|nr:ABC transporter permease [Armatimonadota bacterium]MDR7485091.1 ABC transporter permease [Armatimonadota bacterium]MDR7533479.1 ABC transporter permease [Armatimonadota bacterium]MDR7537020.1 ABC transporter permease [Armatimonadota bacterium]